MTTAARSNAQGSGTLLLIDDTGTASTVSPIELALRHARALRRAAPQMQVLVLAVDSGVRLLVTREGEDASGAFGVEQALRAGIFFAVCRWSLQERMGTQPYQPFPGVTLVEHGLAEAVRLVREGYVLIQCVAHRAR